MDDDQTSRSRSRGRATALVLSTVTLLGATTATRASSAPADDIEAGRTARVAEGDLQRERRIDGTVVPAGTRTIVARGVDTGEAPAATAPAVAPAGGAGTGAPTAPDAPCPPATSPADPAPPTQPPTTEPPTEEPPAGDSPTEEPTAAEPPAGDSPTEEPTAAEPPPDGEPGEEQLPADGAPQAGEATPGDEPPVERPPTEAPPVEEAPTGEPPGDDAPGPQPPITGDASCDPAQPASDVPSAPVGGRPTTSAPSDVPATTGDEPTGPTAAPAGGAPAGAAPQGTSARAGVVSDLAAIGETLDRGDVAHALDGRPVVVLLGATAPYRTLEDGIDDGDDVRTLEENLAALGFGDGLTVDSTFDEDTTDAVEAWQASVGHDEDGSVDPADVVVLEQASVVAGTSIEIGEVANAGDALLEVAPLDAEVQLALPVDDALAMVDTAGLTVEVGDVRLDGGEARLTEVVRDDDGNLVATLRVRLPVGVLPTAWVGRPATVVVDEGIDDTTLVPAGAVHEVDGVAVVTVVDAGGGTRDVVVTPTASAWGVVAVDGTGDLADGTVVVLPS